MSSYTMQLREYVESWSQYESLSIKDRIEKGRTKLFDFDYPIFDVNYKKVFETHFIRHFYMREIGFETEGLFKFQLETWMLINMPYFNKLFESETIKFDPLINSEMQATHKNVKDVIQKQDSTSDATGNQTTTGSTTTDNFNRHLESTTPESRLSITAKDGEGLIEYASSIDENTENNKVNSTGNGSSSSNVNSNVNGSINETEDYIQNRTGKIGVVSYSKMLNEYRDSFIRIEKKIFDEMQELFMLVY